MTNFFTPTNRENKFVERYVVTKLNSMLDDFNIHAKAFRMARDMLKHNTFLDLKLNLISDRPGDSRVYNRPTFSEVDASILVILIQVLKRHYYPCT